MYVYRWHLSVYGRFYWISEIVLAILGYGLIAEIYSQALGRYPGVSQFARISLAAILGLIAMKVTLDLFENANLSFASLVVELERYLRLTQAGLLVLFLFLLLYYKIPVGRNLRGLVTGYVFFIVSSVISFPFISDPGIGLAHLVRKMEPTFYLISLLIWLISLWTYYPEPQTESSNEILKDYGQLVQETVLLLHRARAYLLKVAGS